MELLEECSEYTHLDFHEIFSSSFIVALPAPIPVTVFKANCRDGVFALDTLKFCSHFFPTRISWVEYYLSPVMGTLT